MLFDLRTYIGKSFDGISQSADTLLKNMDRLSIEKSVAIPFKPIHYDLEAANLWLYQTIQPHSDRLVGAARIDPWQPDARQHLEKAIESYAMRALYLDPWQEQFRADLEMLDPLLNCAQEHHLPVIIASGYPWRSEALQVLKIALRWPEVRIIMTNGGQINISGLGQADVTLALQKANNLMIETAGVYRQDFLEESVQEFGAARVLFGSGSPLFDQAYEVKRVVLLNVNPSEKLAIQSENAHRLFIDVNG